MEQHSEEWFAARLGKFSASEIYNLMVKGRGKGEHFGATALEYIKTKLAERMTGERPQISSVAMDWGTNHEDEARKLYEVMTGNQVQEVGFIQLGSEDCQFYEWAGGSPDGVVFRKDIIIDRKKPLLYYVYHSMKQRCNNPKNKAYKNYGERGIKICEEWGNYNNFKIWALENGYEEGKEINRKDNEKGYSPQNCEFTYKTANQRNKRNNVLDTQKVEEIKKKITEGEKVCDLVKEYNVNKNVIIHIKKLRQWKDIGAIYNQRLKNMQNLPLEEFSQKKSPKVEGIIEIKAPYNTTNHLEAWIEDGIPEKYYKKYYTQCQFNMMCAEAKWCDFISYDPRIKNPKKRLYIKRIEKDPLFCSELLDRLYSAIEIIKEWEEKLK